MLQEKGGNPLFFIRRVYGRRAGLLDSKAFGRTKLVLYLGSRLSFPFYPLRFAVCDFKYVRARYFHWVFCLQRVLVPKGRRWSWAIDEIAVLVHTIRYVVIKEVAIIC
jgi:hypothetical protein